MNKKSLTERDISTKYIVPAIQSAGRDIQQQIITKVIELQSMCDDLEAKFTQAESASSQLLSAAVHHLLESV